LIAVATDANVELRVEPTFRTAKTITIESVPAIKAYSIAVAAASSLANRTIRFFTAHLAITNHPGPALPAYQGYQLLAAAL
jgi:hypothetical protein